MTLLFRDVETQRTPPSLDDDDVTVTCACVLQSLCMYVEDTDGAIVDECHEFERLTSSMETVGFSRDTQQRCDTISILCNICHVLEVGTAILCADVC